MPTKRPACRSGRGLCAAVELDPSNVSARALLLGMIALIAAVEGSLAAHRIDFATPWTEDWRFSAWAAREKSPGCDVLCFGDSLVKYGVMPRVIEARTGLKSYNLATSGGTMPTAFFLFRQALDAGVVDELVVSVAPVVLSGGKRLFEGFTRDLDLEIRSVHHSTYAVHTTYAVVG